MMPDCPKHKETDGSPMKAIWRNKHGYYFCSTCLRELDKQNKEKIEELNKKHDKALKSCEKWFTEVRKLKEEIGKLENDCLRYDRDLKELLSAIKNIPSHRTVENPDFEFCAKKDENLKYCGIERPGDCRHCDEHIKTKCDRGEIIENPINFKEEVIKLVERTITGSCPSSSESGQNGVKTNE